MLQDLIDWITGTERMIFCYFPVNILRTGSTPRGQNMGSLPKSSQSLDLEPKCNWFLGVSTLTNGLGCWSDGRSRTEIAGRRKGDSSQKAGPCVTEYMKCLIYLKKKSYIQLFIFVDFFTAFLHVFYYSYYFQSSDESSLGKDSASVVAVGLWQEEDFPHLLSDNGDDDDMSQLS